MLPCHLPPPPPAPPQCYLEVRGAMCDMDTSKPNRPICLDRNLMVG